MTNKITFKKAVKLADENLERIEKRMCTEVNRDAGGSMVIDPAPFSWGMRGGKYPCTDCGKVATELWADSGMIGVVHGNYERLCLSCAYRRQLTHARKQAERIPELEAAIERLESEER